MEQTTERLEIDVIPATIRATENGGQIAKLANLRVAAYCRVSTGDESQQTSYTTQKRFYTQLITSKPGWTLAGIYADEAISGTSRAKRKQFNEMMQSALAGEIDYIVTKSISRFARNTIDTLDCVRQLRQANPPVGIFFEKENIDTLDATGELILTILSALAQDESRSISDNIRWAIQRKFQRGEAIVDLKRMLGYDKGPEGEWVINPEQAEIVQYIFNRFVCGVSSNAIARELNARGKTTVKGNMWRADAVLYILRNEKYVGDCENQKYVTKNFLTHQTTINHGEMAKYYVRNHHAAIIDRLTWNKVQAMLINRAERTRSGAEPEKRQGSRASVFSNLICGERRNGSLCGERLLRLGYNNVVRNYTDSRALAEEGNNPAGYVERYYYYYPVWRCGRNVRGKQGTDVRCAAGSTYECALEQSFMETLYFLKRDMEKNGDESWLMRKFYEESVGLEQGGTDTTQQLKTVEMQLHELEKKLLEAADASIEQHIQERIEALQRECEALTPAQGAAAIVQNNFDFFVSCLKALPETNAAGMKVNVYGLDVQAAALEQNWPVLNTKEMLKTAPDFLPFEKGIYAAFVKKGIVDGDTVAYQTRFGVTLVTTGNSRNLGSFLGFRRANPDGTVMLLDEKWKVSGREVCYTRKRRGEKNE